MRLVIAAVGRLRPGAERELVERYAGRAARSGRALGLSGPEFIEIDESRAGTAVLRRQAEAERLIAAAPAGCRRIALDAAGRALSTRELTGRLVDWRDAGAPAAAFLIGGPDGHGPALLDAADLVLSLGPMTWPHMLARVMLAEQLYRAVTILAGHPYHRA